MTRSAAETLAAAYAALLWDDAPICGPNDGIDRGARQARPTVVAGYDDRSSSPTIFAALVGGLRRMGCHVIDIGLATRPCLSFAVDHFHASAGVYATGSGGEPSWTGIDFVGHGGRPLSLGNGLERIRERAKSPLSRPTRIAGSQRIVQANGPYEESLKKHFDGLRPWKIVCASPSPLVRKTTERAFASLPGELVAVDLPVRVRNPVHRRDADMLRLSSQVRELRADLGILIDDDGQRCGLIDERGRHLSPATIPGLLIPQLLAERPGGTVLLEPGAFAELRPWIETMGGTCRSLPGPVNALGEAPDTADVVYAGGDSGRHWFTGTSSDALITLAKTLSALNRADAPISALIGGPQEPRTK